MSTQLKIIGSDITVTCTSCACYCYYSLLFIFFSHTAVGEIVIYVDGMLGLINCNEMIQWLYQLTTSKVNINHSLVCVANHIMCNIIVIFLFQFKMVIKTVLDTLLLFVSFNESSTSGSDGSGGRSGSPDSASGANTAQLFFEAVEAHSEKKGAHT